MNTRKTNDFLNGVPGMLLLRLLQRRPMYGYQLVQSIQLASGDALSFGEGCIYPVFSSGPLVTRPSTVECRAFLAVSSAAPRAWR